MPVHSGAAENYRASPATWIHDDDNNKTVFTSNPSQLLFVQTTHTQFYVVAHHKKPFPCFTGYKKERFS